MIIFVASLLLAIGGFVLLNFLAGTNLLRWVAPRGEPFKPVIEVGMSNLYYEHRSDTGQLEYVITARSSIPVGNGQFALEYPRAIYYLKDNRMIELTADKGAISGQQIGGRLGKWTPKSGSLSQHVCLTMGPADSFRSDTKERQPGQWQFQLENDIQFTYADRTIESHGPLKVRHDRVAFDGHDLTLTFNMDQRRVEYLRIDRGDKIVIRQVQQGEFGLGGRSTTAPGTQISPEPRTTGQVPQVASATKSGTEPTAYKLIFQENVKAALGTRALAGDQIAVIFQAVATDVARKGSEAVPTTAPTEVPATTPATAPRPTPASPADPIAPPTAEDLVITWSGPMEMQPMATAQTGLASAKDTIFEATAAGNHAVVLDDGPTRRMRAGRVLYHAATQQFLVEPAHLPNVEMAEDGKGRLICRGINYQQSQGVLALAGPGQAEVFPSAWRTITTAPAVPAANETPLVAKWTRSFNLALAEVPDPKNPGKKTLSITRATLAGDADVRDPTFWIHATDTLDTFLAQTGDARQPQALERLLATGGVQVQSLRNNGAPQPDGISGQRLELLTALPEGSKVPQPSRLLVDGNVVAVSYQQNKDDPKKFNRQQLAAPSLQAALEPKAASATQTARNAQDILGSAGLKQVVATGGVKVELEGFGAQLVVATCDRLTADPKAGTALLDGVKTDQPGQGWARLQQGENQIAGLSLHLAQKEQSLEIPGTGEFIFLQPGNKNQAPQPVRVTWTRQMTYSGKDLLAVFSGPVQATLLGKPDQESTFTATNSMQVKLARAALAAADGTTRDRIVLDRITADGKVEALGASYALSADGRDRQLLTRVYMRSTELVYEDARKTLRIPKAGQLLVEDYRPQDKPTAAAPATNRSPFANQSGARGQTVFSWGESLTYTGDTGDILLKKDVAMVHNPSRPIRIGQPAAAKGSANAAEIEQVKLACNQLAAHLLTTNAPASSPVALGLGGQTRIAKVTAEGASQAAVAGGVLSQAVLEFGKNSLTADVLEFDALANRAVAYGRDGHFATVIRPEEEGGIGQAERIEWEMKNGNQGLVLKKPRGVISTPP